MGKLYLALMLLCTLTASAYGRDNWVLIGSTGTPPATYYYDADSVRLNWLGGDDDDIRKVTIKIVFTKPKWALKISGFNCKGWPDNPGRFRIDHRMYTYDKNTDDLISEFEFPNQAYQKILPGSFEDTVAEAVCNARPVNR